MRTTAIAVAAAVLLAGGQARADQAADNQREIQGCVRAAADIYRLPPAVLVVLLDVEGGSLGRVSPNTNRTVDIGPMQVNEIWLPQVAEHWHATLPAAFRALRDDFCANVEAGAWILRQGLDEAHGNFWEGVGYYHSHDPGYKATYLRAVLAQVLRLRSMVQCDAADASSGKASDTPSVARAPSAPAGVTGRVLTARN